MNRSHQLLAALTSAACLLAISGCASSTATAPPVASQGSPLTGIVHGGQQPVAGATIQLYATGTTGYGSAARPLIKTPVTTDANGNFSLAGTYTCQTGDLVYLVATGGNPGEPGTQNNSGLALMAGLGPCSGITSSTFISVNELTTVATIWSLSPFMTTYAKVGSSATNISGLANAFLGLNTILNTASGTLPGATFPSGATLPLNEINTLADILAVCINSVDTTSPAQLSSQCQTLFTATATPASTPADTIQAAINLAQNPTLGLTLGSTVTSTAPFEPTLAGTPPAAWTIAINYLGGGLSTPTGIALDASGNVFVSNKGNNSVAKFDTTGNAISGPAGFTAGSLSSPSALAIDINGNAWVANAGNSTVTLLTSNGATGTPFTGGGLNAPNSIAIDSIGDIWVTNFGNSSVSELSSNGTILSDADGYQGGDVALPIALAINPK